MTRFDRRRWIVLFAAVLCLAACTSSPKKEAATGAYPNVIVPIPVSAVAAEGVTFTLPTSATIASDVPGIGDYLAGILRASTGYAIPVRNGDDATIALRLTGAPKSVGDQGYRLTITSGTMTVEANQAAGLFAGVQTLLQALPAKIMSPKTVAATWTAAGGTILDYPRFTYRGAMLDVARHFFTVAQVEHYIDEVAAYKINYLHLHLSDDQGWRIAINGWPQLTEVGASTAVNGDPGGYYTQADYSAIVAYAASRYMTVIPEIDMPGHTNAALASYPKLDCDGTATAPYTGIDTGFSSLCVSADETYAFLDDVIGQLAALTPGPYLHIGGDESSATPPAQYAAFVDKAQQIVAAHGKTVIGWHNIDKATLLPSTVAEFWDTDTVSPTLAKDAAAGTKVIMAPASHAYLDQKYDDNTKLGLEWAGPTEVNTAYDWNPGAYVVGIDDQEVLGVEAALWTETLSSPADLDYMAFPRLPAIAEVGWSPWSTHDVSAFDSRLGAQGPRWTAEGIAFYYSGQVDWVGDVS